HFFYFNLTLPTLLYTLSLHDALPIYPTTLGRSEITTEMAEFQLYLIGHGISSAVDLRFLGMRIIAGQFRSRVLLGPEDAQTTRRSEEHTSELQSRSDLVCRLLLEKKK